MNVLVVEDDRRIKTETIDDCLASLGYASDWAQNQQEANGLLAGNDYDLVLLDLQIPSRPGGKDLPEFGKNLLKQIRGQRERDVPVILMTAHYQDCVDLMTELQKIGLDGSIAKPFPTSGRTLAVVIAEVMAKHRRFRQAARACGPDQPLTPFAGGVLAFHSRHVDLCGETIAARNQKGYAWRILEILSERNDRGGFVRMGSGKLADKLHPNLAQNTLIQSIKALRDRITAVMRDRLGYDCGAEDVIANGGQGYRLSDWITVEQEGEATPPSRADESVRPASAPVQLQQFTDRQRWILAQLGSQAKLTRRAIQDQFSISERTAKRELSELTNAGMITFDRSQSPGWYRLSS